MRHGFRVVLVWVLILALAGAGAVAASSYYYESITTTRAENKRKGQQDLMRGWVDGPKVRIEFPQGGQGGRVGEGAYILTTDAGVTVYMVDPKQKTYFKFDLASLMGSLEAMSSGMFNIEFRDFSSEKLLEEAGGSVLGHDTTHFKVRSRFTMEMNAMGMKRVSTMDTTQDVWMTRELSSEAWSMWLKMMPTGGAVDEFTEWAAQSGLTEGFPLKSSATTTTTNRKGKSQTMIADMEVTVLRVEPIAPSVFEIPPDFAETAVIPPGMGGESQDAQGPLKRFKGMFGKKKKKDGGR